MSAITSAESASPLNPVRDLMETAKGYALRSSLNNYNVRSDSYSHKRVDGFVGPILRSYLPLEIVGLKSLLSSRRVFPQMFEPFLKGETNKNLSSWVKAYAIYLKQVDPATYTDSNGLQEKLREVINSTALSASEKEARIRTLAELGVDLNFIDMGFSPLGLAIQREDLASTRAVIQSGANVNVADLYNKTLLHWAVQKGNLDIVRILIEVGAKVNEATILQGITPLGLTRMNLDLEGADQDHIRRYSAIEQALINAGAH